ncbi:hypothetical protein LEP1GSC101_0819 [Leptospira borgpetersenii str. UI 09149]|nr:hypothetical protein LEP1GSC101_0819 [Leptospira borgpetersenii str. UI 09149]
MNLLQKSRQFRIRRDFAVTFTSLQKSPVHLLVDFSESINSCT